MADDFPSSSRMEILSAALPPVLRRGLREPAARFLPPPAAAASLANSPWPTLRRRASCLTGGVRLCRTHFRAQRAEPREHPPLTSVAPEMLAWLAPPASAVTV